MGTEAFVELLWRIHTKPGIVETSPGRISYVPVIKAERTSVAKPVSEFFNLIFPRVVKLGDSTFGETI